MMIQSHPSHFYLYAGFCSYLIRLLFTYSKDPSFNCEFYSGCLNSPEDHKESEITKYFMQNTLCAELCRQIDEWNSDPVHGIEFWFHTVLQKKDCYM